MNNPRAQRGTKRPPGKSRNTAKGITAAGTFCWLTSTAYSASEREPGLPEGPLFGMPILLAV
jgi:hypothetical protein